MGACFSTPEERAARERLEAEQRRLEHWRATGFVSLRDAALNPLNPNKGAAKPRGADANAKAAADPPGSSSSSDDDDGGPIRRLPRQVADLGAAARVLDVADNALEDLSGVERLVQLQRMVLSGNALTSLPRGDFPALLWLLAARNRIGPSLDPCDDLGARLPRLERLVLARNNLEALPGSCLRGLKRLRVLALAHNALEALPGELGDLESLEELDAQHNRLAALPAPLARCARLRAVLVSHNRIDARGLPGELFAEGALPLLQTLALKFNPVQQADLAGVPGCLAFDARARAAALGGAMGTGLLRAMDPAGSGGESLSGGGGGGGGGGGAQGDGCHPSPAALAAAASSGRGVLVGGTGAEDAAAVALRKTDSREIAPVALLLASGASKRRLAAGEDVLAAAGGEPLEALEEDDAAALAESGVRPGVLASALRRGSGRGSALMAAAEVPAAEERRRQDEGGGEPGGGFGGGFGGGGGGAPHFGQHRRPFSAAGAGLGTSASLTSGHHHRNHFLQRQASATEDDWDVGSVASLRAPSASTGGNVLAVARRSRSFASSAPPAAASLEGRSGAGRASEGGVG